MLRMYATVCVKYANKFNKKNKNFENYGDRDNTRLRWATS